MVIVNITILSYFTKLVVLAYSNSTADIKIMSIWLMKLEIINFSVILTIIS